MNRRFRRAVAALAIPALLIAGTPAPVAFAAETTTTIPVAIAPCEGEAPICNPPVHVPVATAGVLRASVAIDASVCAGVTILLSVDGALAASVPVAPGGSTGDQDLGPVSAGAHTLSIEAEVPFLVTCDSRAWSGVATITTSGVAAGDRADVGPGGSATVSTVVAGSPHLAGITATLDRSSTATGTATISVLTYDALPPNPILPPSPISPVAYLDLQLLNPDPGDTIAGEFLPPSPILPPNPVLPPSPIVPPNPILPPNPIRLAYWSGSSWAPVHGSGGALPTYSSVAGSFSALFDSTSTPAVTALGGTVFAIIPSYYVRAFGAPVENDGVPNIAKAGRAVPLKWQLFDATTAPVTDLEAGDVQITSVQVDCAGPGTPGDPLEEYATGGSSLQNVGGGVYQLNWDTAKAYAGSCRQLRLDLGERNPDGTPFYRTAEFRFTK
jgi:hypothetical protein